MVSEQAYNAIEDALKTGRALLKFISANDVNATGGHQTGYYLPKSARELYTSAEPVKGRNEKSEVTITWPEGIVTDSVITWYGRGTRSEYRLTRFGADFPWQSTENIGDLLVIVPHSHQEFSAYVLDSEDDFEEIQVGLGLEINETWGVYDSSKGGSIIRSPEECIDAHFRAFTKTLNSFPSGRTFSDAAKQALENCIRAFGSKSFDEQLISLTRTEYQLFRFVERQMVHTDIAASTADVDAFLKTASSIMNRRKSRAGRSLENHVQDIFRAAGLTFDAQAVIEGGKKPDLLFPGKTAYESDAYPADKLRLVGIKTSCKDRWRQVLSEGSRVACKHIVTLQQGITSSQLIEMKQAGITLVVPEPLHSLYPPVEEHGMNILTINQFISDIKQVQA